MNRNKVLTIILIIFLLSTLTFIWTNSLQSIPESQARSLGFLEKVRPFLERFFGTGNVDDHLVRKLAHFVEFVALGCELALLLLSRWKFRLPLILISLFGGMAVALTDETIQIFSQRGSQVQDVWLDFAGVCAGFLFVTAIFGIVKACKKRRKTAAKS